jgi:putative nucleotidyltransferase with HDIG domain
VDLVLDDAPIGTLYIANLLDERYAATLAELSNARIVVADGDRLIASTLDAWEAQAFERAILASRQTDGTVSLNGEPFAFRRLVTIGDAGVYALGSIDASSAAATRQALGTMALIALGAGILALVGSLWLAHLLTEPIGRLSTSLQTMSRSRDARGTLPLSGSSRELDTLIETFNDLMMSVTAAEAQTEAAYTGAIRALAAALDARDPYTAGHSERVSVLSVAMGRTLGLSNDELEVLRLGALLHDIGKIGVPDSVLRKAGPLTDSEYDQIKQHPVLGARILRSVPFLAPHLPIVELHHERPDGAGYPYGLQSDATPLAARIVHVADAYDAMTSARAYRGARSSSAALHELWRCSGTAFDAALVEALTLSLPGAAAGAERPEPSVVHA